MTAGPAAMPRWHRPAGTATDTGFEVAVRPGAEGWSHTGLLVAELAPGETRTIGTGGGEWLVLPLSGGALVTLEAAGATTAYRLDGRTDVWSGPTDLVYAPRDACLTVTAPTGARIAFPFAPARAGRPGCRVPAAAVPVEVRGAGAATRLVRNFGMPGVLEADSLMACEVLTPAGNWSSYPPHKHDEDRPGLETELSEIYYFQLRTEPGAKEHPACPVGYHRVYGTAERPISVLAEVRSGDVVLVPHGWHGPAMAAPGYDMYYLNVMAGPGPERAWSICDDPAHAWVRTTWEGRGPDPRLARWVPDPTTVEPPKEPS